MKSVVAFKTIDNYRVFLCHSLRHLQEKRAAIQTVVLKKNVHKMANIFEKKISLSVLMKILFYYIFSSDLLRFVSEL